tara:strand:- start:415 stop:1011 length:597 start_codon:yes stop_codon:yes gene_type:complete
MIKLGVFILPNKKLKKILINNKKKVKKIFGKQKYLSHPPHCTICVLNISKKSINKIKKEKISVPKLSQKYKLLKTDIFINDPMTRGNTMVFKIEKNKFLKNLQLNILRILNKYILKSKKKYKDKKMQSNFKKFGYPFVNSNWYPHFTIASISKSASQKQYFKDFKQKMISRSLQKITHVFFFIIKKDNHKLICLKKII